MVKETAEAEALALDGSIEKWERIVEGSGLDLGIKNCPLCHLFHIHYKPKISLDDPRFYWDEDLCEGCPVKKKSGYSSCANTPYTDFKQYFNEYYPVDHYKYAHVFDKESKRLAMVELEFLKSLREE